MTRAGAAGAAFAVAYENALAYAVANGFADAMANACAVAATDAFALPAARTRAYARAVTTGAAHDPLHADARHTSAYADLAEGLPTALKHGRAGHPTATCTDPVTGAAASVYTGSARHLSL